ncbi:MULTISPECIES: hypothetical protein [unclassified Nocardiopsis]|uniref:hypothetical protein n=1 Tax=Nocardiopsis TaxID=2013 RepID=UPI00387AEC5F
MFGLRKCEASQDEVMHLRALITSLTLATAMLTACSGTGDNGDPKNNSPEETTGEREETSQDREVEIHSITDTGWETVPPHGVILTQNAAGGCVVLRRTSDGEVGEVARFDPPAESAELQPCHERDSFNRDYTVMLAVDKPQFNQDVVVAVGADGTSLPIGSSPSGTQLSPVFHPGDDRVYYWSVDGLEHELRSVNADGTDDRGQDDFTRSVSDGYDETANVLPSDHFTFFGGEMFNTTYLADATVERATTLEDGSLAVYRDEGSPAFRVGPVATLRTNPEYTTTGTGHTFTPKAMVDATTVVGANGSEIFVGRIDGAARTVEVQALVQPDQPLSDMARVPFVAGDGAVYYSVVTTLEPNQPQYSYLVEVGLRDATATPILGIELTDGGNGYAVPIEVR